VHDRDLLPHEFTHSWTGKFRRPALWTPNYNVPMQDSLLWVYEGQTQYWGQVLAARSGLWSAQQALDEMAYTAAYYQLETGRQWRPLGDTTNDEIIDPRRPQSWTDWQRFEDYNGAAFKAQLTEGGQILAVNGIAYDPDVLKDAIRAAKGDSQPIELIVRTGDRYRVARVDYHQGLRYPHLQRQGTGPALLDEILTPRP
jgi:predicted metalloprotease with PDZ domain